MFKVENVVDNLAFWLSFIRELVDTLLPPPVQYPFMCKIIDSVLQISTPQRTFPSPFITMRESLT